MRCLRCAVDYEPDERYCLRCGRALSRPPGADRGEGGRFSTVQDTQYLYTTHSPPAMGNARGTPPEDEQTLPPTSTEPMPYSLSPILHLQGAGEQITGNDETEPPANMPFQRRLRRMREEDGADTGVYIAPPANPDALPWNEQYVSTLPLGDEDEEDHHGAAWMKPAAIGIDAGSWRTKSGRRQDRRAPKMLAAAIVVAVLALLAAVAIVRHNAYAHDLQAARDQAVAGAYAAALAHYQAAIDEWPFNDTAKREQANLRIMAASVAQRNQADTATTASRQAMFQARSAQRQAVAQQADADAIATVTAVAQLRADAQAQATAHAQATGTMLAANAAASATAQGTVTAVAGLHAVATAQAQRTATAVAAIAATTRAEANATVIRLPSGNTRPLIYAAIGASDAVGVGATNPATESWVADLSRKLPSGSQLIDLGKSGAQLSYGLTQELPAAIASHPDLVTVWMVVNDINARISPTFYRQELDSLLTGLRTQTHAAIYVGNVPDLTLLPVYRGLDKTQLTAVIQAFNQIIAQVAAAHKVTVVDLYHESQQTIPGHPEYISGDGFHPSTPGYVDLANYWWRVMQQG